jgi:hypothetical protein
MCVTMHCYRFAVVKLCTFQQFKRATLVNFDEQRFNLDDDLPRATTNASRVACRVSLTTQPLTNVQDITTNAYSCIMHVCIRKPCLQSFWHFYFLLEAFKLSCNFASLCRNTPPTPGDFYLLTPRIAFPMRAIIYCHGGA